MQYANGLNDRINQGIEEIGKCREAIIVYEGQMEKGKAREAQLQQQVAMLEPVLQENGDLK